MSTTAIFAELLVAGIEATVWIAVLILSFTSTDRIQPAEMAKFKDWAALITIAAVGICYAVGVVVDRLADSSLRYFDARFRRSVFKDEDFSQSVEHG